MARGRMIMNRAIALGWTWLAAIVVSSSGADLAQTRTVFLSGNYDKTITQCEEALKSDTGEEDWPLLLTESLMALGRYSNAQAVITRAIEQFPFSLRTKLLAREVSLYNGDGTKAREYLEEMAGLANRRQWAYRDAQSLVALGKAALLMGVDPKKVLENTFDRAKKADPDLRDAHAASVQVALDKSDFDLAAKLATEALKKFPKDPDFHYARAQALAGSDRKAMLESLSSALEINENHVPSYLLIADHMIDAEEYEEAESKISRALEVNPHHPLAWAYRAVMAHLRNELAQEADHRKKALAHYAKNPAVDYLIGRKLSQKYRFSEGAAYQRRALAFDPEFTSAKSQLAQDLLRLGEDQEGWTLAEQVHQEDGYDVVAYNLANLKDTMNRFATLTNQFFTVRMGASEAPIYGDRVLALLTRAHTNLSLKYGIELQTPTFVEIFPDQKDFAVRTFGMPGGAGYLGVCFGRVITANSPATQAGRAASWESVLWHEFAHVVTLQMTKNKMPRWLSEGISVYEEQQSNPAWGQAMTPRYREMILGDDLVKIGELSGAFLAPPSGEHLMFAYYQSSLVVRYLVENFGFESLLKILRDLKLGVPINDAIARHTTALDKLETNFAAFARKLATELAPGLEWEKPEAEDLVSKDGEPAEWLRKNPKNYYALLHSARADLKNKQWKKAQEPLRKLIELFPIQTEPGNAYQLLAQAHRALKETAEEKEVLTAWSKIDAHAADAYLRLMELAEKDRNWSVVFDNVRRYLAVNPLSHQAYAYWGRAAEATLQPAIAVQAYQTLLRLDPPDPAGTHFRLAKLFHDQGSVAAKRHLLQALEEAPRFREAHELLLKLNASSANPPPAKP
jgi:tetratricopeptide (TPR) repeat protein